MSIVIPLLLRYRDGQLLPTAAAAGRNGSGRYEGATPDRPSLIIRSVSKEDIGDYACVLENEAGVGESRNMTTLETLCEYHDRTGRTSWPTQPAIDTVWPTCALVDLVRVYRADRQGLGRHNRFCEL